MLVLTGQEIDEAEIKKAYGGIAPTPSYGGGWSYASRLSSASSAYMLMYRRLDRTGAALSCFLAPFSFTRRVPIGTENHIVE